MAEKGAHLTQTVQSRPSIFDFIAHEALNDLLYPSVRRIIDILALRNDVFISVSRWFDEWFLLSHSALQLYYLKKYGATFSEKFYGLQRVSLKNSNSNSNSLGKREIVLSLLAVSLFPYLKAKLNKLSDRIALDDIPRTNQQTAEVTEKELLEFQKEKIILMKSVIYCNSGLNIFHQFLKIVQHLRFLSGKSDINSPLLWAAGVKLKYTDENLSQEALTFRNFIPQLLQRSLEVSAFFMQFFRWWQTEKGSNFTILPVPPPPQKSENGMRYRDKCPICLKKRNTETALSTSGFVFCFKCITNYVMTHNTCPVTKLPATVDNLIRIYPPS